MENDYLRQENKILRGEAGCRRFHDRLIEEVQPACVLAWGSSFPPSVVLHRAAQARGVPVWIWERGLLPDTRFWAGIGDFLMLG